MNVAPDFSTEAQEIVRRVAATGECELAIAFVKSCLGAAFARGGLKALDMVQESMGPAPARLS